MQVGVVLLNKNNPKRIFILFYFISLKTYFIRYLRIKLRYIYIFEIIMLKDIENILLK